MNRGEPSDDPSKIRGEILSSGDPLTLPRTYIIHGVAPKILSFSSTLGGVDTPTTITGDSYKNGGEVNNTR
ncbi:hypothetical protein IHE45_14G072700 [Dioscorea alata]|uniref:Uncharacterized protein n=1 Tax=Dioscorea alata TaxID=55571 RepID=A0ACB7USP1_DIOAL|nr:hypothetical protein IHE45_14G072700 [Dioscorea alata]